MEIKLDYKIKVYAKRATIYPTETYEPKSLNHARTMFNVMKRLDPYSNKRIEVIEYVYVNKEIKEINTLFKKE